MLIGVGLLEGPAFAEDGVETDLETTTTTEVPPDSATSSTDEPAPAADGTATHVLYSPVPAEVAAVVPLVVQSCSDNSDGTWNCSINTGNVPAANPGFTPVETGCSDGLDPQPTPPNDWGWHFIAPGNNDFVSLTVQFTNAGTVGPISPNAGNSHPDASHLFVFTAENDTLTGGTAVITAASDPGKFNLSHVCAGGGSSTTTSSSTSTSSTSSTSTSSTSSTSTSTSSTSSTSTPSTTSTSTPPTSVLGTTIVATTVPGSSGTAGGVLPRTGSDLWFTVLVGGVLLLTGLGLRLSGRLANSTSVS